MKSEKLGGETRDYLQAVPDCMSVTSESLYICHRILAHPLQNQCLCKYHGMASAMTMALMTMLVMLVIMTASVFIVQSTPEAVLSTTGGCQEAEKYASNSLSHL